MALWNQNMAPIKLPTKFELNSIKKNQVEEIMGKLLLSHLLMK